MDEQKTLDAYEPPALVEVGEFGEDTLGGVPTVSFDYPTPYFFSEGRRVCGLF
jgi:hypothetical protein